jgi:hypothetical protein
MRDDEHTDDIVILEGHVPRDCFEEIQIDNDNDEDHQYSETMNEETFLPSLTDVLSKSIVIRIIDSE